jgi:acyl-CoA hydrolase
MKISIQQLKFNNAFVVLPKHCNYMYPLIFGGAFMAELDLCAAVLANKIVKMTNDVDNAVTYKADITFEAPSYSGDVIHMEAQATELRKKSISITVYAYREPRDTEQRKLVAVANFVFITRIGEVYHPHNLEII